MSLWPVILMAYALGLALARDEISMVMRGEVPAGIEGYATLILLGLVAGHLLLFVALSSSRQIRIGLLSMIGVAGFAGLEYKTELGDVSARLLKAGRPVVAVATTSGGSTELRRNWNGHFRAVAMIGNSEIPMLVDTGASVVLLRFEDAKKAGINVNAIKFDAAVDTASGRSHVALVDIDRISVGGVAVEHVKAAVAQPGVLHASLLGMSYLSGLSEMVIAGDVMELRN